MASRTVSPADGCGASSDQPTGPVHGPPTQAACPSRTNVRSAASAISVVALCGAPTETTAGRARGSQSVKRRGVVTRSDCELPKGRSGARDAQSLKHVRSWLRGRAPARSVAAAKGTSGPWRMSEIGCRNYRWQCAFGIGSGSNTNTSVVSSGSMWLLLMKPITSSAQVRMRRGDGVSADHPSRRRDDRGDLSSEQHAQREVYRRWGFGLLGLVSDARGGDHGSMRAQ
jgi:hypothetical protein